MSALEFSLVTVCSVGILLCKAGTTDFYYYGEIADKLPHRSSVLSGTFNYLLAGAPALETGCRGCNLDRGYISGALLNISFIRYPLNSGI
jgi:hypothetical protein